MCHFAPQHPNDVMKGRTSYAAVVWSNQCKQLVASPSCWKEASYLNTAAPDI